MIRHFKVKAKYKSILFYVILGILIIPCYKLNYTFAKYVFDRSYDNYLLSKDFYFESDMLKKPGKSYEVDDWDGIGEYDLRFYLFNFTDELRWTKQNINYTMEADCDPSVFGSVACEVSDGTINTSNISGTSNIVYFTLSNPNNLVFDNDDYVMVTITATSTSPYRKVLSATIKIGVTNDGIKYRIVDAPNQKYFDVEIDNTTEYNKNISLSWTPTVVSVDNSNHTFQWGTNKTVLTIDSVDYYSGFSLNIPAYTSYFVRYFKTDVTEDYTYPSSGALPVVILSNN